MTVLSSLRVIVPSPSCAERARACQGMLEGPATPQDERRPARFASGDAARWLAAHLIEEPKGFPQIVDSPLRQPLDLRSSLLLLGPGRHGSLASPHGPLGAANQRSWSCWREGGIQYLLHCTWVFCGDHMHPSLLSQYSHESSSQLSSPWSSSSKVVPGRRVSPSTPPPPLAGAPDSRPGWPS